MREKKKWRESGLKTDAISNRTETEYLRQAMNEIETRITKARDKAIAASLRVPTGVADLDTAMTAQANRYDRHKMNGREEGWKTIVNLVNLADLADRAYLANLADLADRAYRAYRAYLANLAHAYLADRADRADLAAMKKTAIDAAILSLGDLIQLQPDLDCRVLSAIEAEGNEHQQSDWGDVCGTTHCRGGWAIMQQPHGAAFYEILGPAFAAPVIYQACTGNIPDFYNMNDKSVLDDIKREAAKQVQS